MVWSLSKDDDGLDSVHPLPTQGGGVVVRGQPAPPNAPPRQAPHAAPKVVVDPVSQVPQAPARAARRHAVEQTLVLKGRKLDEIRAQVAAQRAVHQRRKQMSLLTWAFAGGIALSLGWLAGLTLDFGSPENEPPAPSTGAPSVRGTARQQDSSPVPEEAPPTPPVAPSQPRRAQEAETLSLADLPSEPEAATSAEVSAQSPTESDDRNASDASGESEAFTLEDLPLD